MIGKKKVYLNYWTIFYHFMTTATCSYACFRNSFFLCKHLILSSFFCVL